MTPTTLRFPATTVLREWTLADGDRVGIDSFELDWGAVLGARLDGGVVLHIGSRASVLDNNRRWRQVFSHCRVIGMDVQDGDNVDVVCDAQAGIQTIRKRCDVKQVDAIVIPHVLEHVAAPWEVAATLQNLLRPGGIILVTVPWVQGYHEFPEDYWRMSFVGVRSLFPRIAFDTEFYTGAKEDKGYRLLFNGVPEHSRRTLRIERNLMQLTLDPQPQQRCFDDRDGDKVALSRLFMPACSVNLIGSKKA